MNIKGKTKIFRKEFNGRPAYSRSIASQEYKDGHKGDWIRTYEAVQIPKGTDIPDGSIVELEGFEAVYKTKDGSVKRKLVVQKFNIIGDNHADVDSYGEVMDEDMPF